MNYSKAIRIARSMSNTTQATLADRSGLDRSYLSLIEGGKRKPTVETLQQISYALRIPFHLLTLLAMGKTDAKKISEEHVSSLARQLTLLLLSDSDDDNKNYRHPKRPAGRKSPRPRVPARGKEA